MAATDPRVGSTEWMNMVASRVSEHIKAANVRVVAALGISAAAFFVGMVMSSVTAYDIKQSNAYRMDEDSKIGTAYNVALATAILQGLAVAGMLIALVCCVVHGRNESIPPQQRT